MKLSRFVPAPTDRAVFVGQTGSGKTTLAQLICGYRPYVVTYDAKGTLNWPGYKVVRTLAQLVKEKSPRITYRPHYDELSDADAVDAFFEFIYRRKHTCCYVDEVFAIARGDVYPYHFGACLTRGREMGVQLYGATQRPMRVPQVLFSESEHVYTFRLRLPQDRERVADVTGLDPIAITQLPKHYFFYTSQDGEPIGPLHLTL